MDKVLIDKFYSEFKIPTQDEDQEFPYANPSDAARALIRAYNWSGTITESLVHLSETLKQIENQLSKIDNKLSVVERTIMANNTPPTWAVKNKETQKAFIWSAANEQELTLLKDIEDKREGLLENLLLVKRDFELHTIMLKNLERSSEWLIQYINWMKMELRMTNE